MKLYIYLICLSCLSGCAAFDWLSGMVQDDAVQDATGDLLSHIPEVASSPLSPGGWAGIAGAVVALVGAIIGYKKLKAPAK